MTSPADVRRLREEVLNQPTALADHNAYTVDRPLREAVRREGAAEFEEILERFGGVCGSAETLALGELANRHTPELQTHDRFGHRVDRVEFHPAWHELLRMGVEAGVHSLAWTDGRPGAHVARAALLYLRHQVEEGASCPLTMTFAAVPSLRRESRLSQTWEPRIVSRHYDPRFVAASEKRGALLGMAMTERQGGSDVRANTTRATSEESHWRLDGHKWFCSAPMCDAFLVLAQAPAGLTCFLLPRFLPDGSPNAGFRIQRLKDKLGNRSNASSEIELHGAWAERVGEEGRGIATIMEMVRHTRLDCALGSAATLRRAVAEALHHAAARRAFGKPLIEQPLMVNVLADLCLESEAATALAFRLAGGFERAAIDPAEAALSRIATAVAKFWIGKRAIAGVAEALEVLGGNGYVETSPLARLYRDVPLNSIWEGSGNVQCLDVLRATQREPAARDALLDELRSALGIEGAYDAHVRRVEAALSQDDDAEARARATVEGLAVGLQASLLLRHGPPAMAQAFCRSRLGDGTGSRGLGTLPVELKLDALIERHRPL